MRSFAERPITGLWRSPLSQTVCYSRIINAERFLRKREVARMNPKGRQIAMISAKQHRTETLFRPSCSTTLSHQSCLRLLLRSGC
jgi:hypothetical protein